MVAIILVMVSGRVVVVIEVKSGDFVAYFFCNIFLIEKVDFKGR